MTPNLGQGACRAIEDAAVLAQCLWVADEADREGVSDARKCPTRFVAPKVAGRAPSVTLR